MSLEEIKKSIDRDAKAQSASISEAGAAEAASILKEAKASASAILSSAKTEAESEAQRVKRERLSEAQMAVSAMLVEAKEAVLEQHIEPLKRSIASELSGKKLGAVIAGAAREFSKFSPKGTMVVKTGGKNAAVAKKLGYDTVRGADDELTVQSRDGTVSIDASPDGLARMHEAEARRLLAARLWNEKGKD